MKISSLIFIFFRQKTKNMFKKPKLMFLSSLLFSTVKAKKIGVMALITKAITLMAKRVAREYCDSLMDRNTKEALKTT